MKGFRTFEKQTTQQTSLVSSCIWASLFARAAEAPPAPPVGREGCWAGLPGPGAPPLPPSLVGPLAAGLDAYVPFAGAGFLAVHRRKFKGAQTRFAHFEKFSLNFSNSSFAIHVNLHYPWPSLFLYDLLLSLWCFSISVNYYFQVSFHLKDILYVAKKKTKHRDWVPLTKLTFSF